MYKTIILFVLAMCAPILVAQTTDRKEPRERTISVGGVGTVSTTPDQVRLSVQVNTRGESASTAMSETSKRTRAILAILKSYGVEDKDVQTSRVTVTAILDYERRIQPPPIVGYNGTNEFSVLFKGKLMDRVGDFIDKAVAAGASSFGGLAYESSKARELEREALRKAAQDARARAELLAKELGATLGDVTQVVESYRSPSPVFMRGRAEALDASSAAPVMSGELKIDANVTVVFELK